MPPSLCNHSISFCTYSIYVTELNYNFSIFASLSFNTAAYILSLSLFCHFCRSLLCKLIWLLHFGSLNHWTWACGPSFCSSASFLKSGRTHSFTSQFLSSSVCYLPPSLLSTHFIPPKFPRYVPVMCFLYITCINQAYCCTRNCNLINTITRKKFIYTVKREKARHFLIYFCYYRGSGMVSAMTVSLQN